MWKSALFVLLAVTLSAAPGCKRDQEVGGIGPYLVGAMKMKDFHGPPCRALEDGVSYCATFETIDVGDHRAAIDLFFADDRPEAPLVEVVLSVRRCREGALAPTLTEMLGEPGERVGHNVLVWPGKRAVAIATLPVEPDLCELSFLSPDQTRRIERLRARARSAGPP